jgi:hypothetical protein
MARYVNVPATGERYNVPNCNTFAPRTSVRAGYIHAVALAMGASEL